MVAAAAAAAAAAAVAVLVLLLLLLLLVVLAVLAMLAMVVVLLAVVLVWWWCVWRRGNRCAGSCAGSNHPALSVAYPKCSSPSTEERKAQARALSTLGNGSAFTKEAVERTSQRQCLSHEMQ